MKENYNDRKVFCLSGADAKDFLQDLITNDIAKAEQGLSYSALLQDLRENSFLISSFLQKQKIFFLIAQQIPQTHSVSD